MNFRKKECYEVFKKKMNEFLKGYQFCEQTVFFFGIVNKMPYFFFPLKYPDIFFFFL